MSHAIVFGRESCPYCVKTKELLAEKNIPFLYIECEKDNKNISPKECAELTSHETWPKIIMNDDWSSSKGYGDLKEKYGK